MPVTTSQSSESVDYRYFACDLMTNELLVELPFKSVSYSRSLNEAGVFSGDIAVTEDTYNLSLYENTLPAKTALYITRDGVCVWGGIIWSRTYDIVGKVLSVSGAEFTSYLHHRVLWKTWSNAYQASIIVAGGVATVTLDFGQYGFDSGEPVAISWGDDMAIYNGTYAVTGTPTLTADLRSVFTVVAEFVDATGDVRTVPDLVLDGLASVEVRQDTYNFAKDLIVELVTDLVDFDFANDTIKPGINVFNVISTAVRNSNNVTTIELSKRHWLVSGQRVAITDVSASFNSPDAIVLSTPSETAFTYANVGSAETITVTPVLKNITNSEASANVVSLTTSGSHGFSVGDIVYVSTVGETIDGYREVYAIPQTNIFQVVVGVDDFSFSGTAEAASALRVGAATYSTHGEYTLNGDIGLEFDPNLGRSGNAKTNPVLRGSSLRTIGEILEEYSSDPNGFEYRVDCTVDAATQSFRKRFVILPLIPAGVSLYLEGQVGEVLSIPAYAFGADQNIFEYPGNVNTASFEESAEDSATRFWVQGNDGGGSDISQPYSGAGNSELLRRGWPLLDQTETIDSNDENTLYDYASRLLTEAAPPINAFAISVNGSINPKLGSYSPGDWCSVVVDDVFVKLRAESYLEKNYGTGDGSLIRKIESYTVTVPDAPSYPEQVELNLVVEPWIPTNVTNI